MRSLNIQNKSIYEINFLISSFAAKRCQCLGSFNRRNYSRDALDMFCRDDRTPLNPDSPTYQVMDSLVKNATGSYIPQIIPNKTRCGNLDPKEMNITEKCYCLAKDKKGAGRFASNEICISHTIRIRGILHCLILMH